MKKVKGLTGYVVVRKCNGTKSIPGLVRIENFDIKSRARCGRFAGLRWPLGHKFDITGLKVMNFHMFKYENLNLRYVFCP